MYIERLLMTQPKVGKLRERKKNACSTIHPTEITDFFTLFSVNGYAFTYRFFPVGDILDKNRGSLSCFCLDDFGKDYSSLAVLEKVSFDIIKIDALFTKNIELIKNQEIVKMVRKITDLSHKRLVIEGVETEAQKDILLDLGCDHQQGFLFHKPEKLC